MTPKTTLALAACLALTAAPAHAAEPAYDLDVAPQPVGQALAELTRQAGLQPLVAEELTRRVQSPGVKGRYTLREAVARVLAGTGLAFEFTGERTVAITRAPPPPPPPAPARAKPQTAELEEVGIMGESDLGYAATEASTGTRTDTPLLETPMAVQVVTPETLKEQRPRRISDALRNVSGITPGGDTGWGDAYVVRGFGSGNLIYEEGARFDYGAAGALTRDLANVERIEVLKGPASILYGQGEPGGLVNTVTKKPLATPYYAVEQSVGYWDAYRTAIDLTGPIVEGGVLGYRVNAAFESARSFRDFVHSKRFNLFPTLQWRPGGEELTLEAHLGTGYEVLFDSGIPFFDGVRAHLPRGRNLLEPGMGKNPVDEYSVRLTWLHPLTERWRLRVDVKYEDVHSLHETPLLSLSGEPATADDPAAGVRTGDVGRSLMIYHFNRANTFNASASASGTVEGWGGRHTLLAGVDYVVYRERFAGNTGGEVAPINIFDPVYGQVTPTWDPANEVLADHVPHAVGVYVQDQLALPHGFHLLAGARLDRRWDLSKTGDPIVRDTPPITPRLGALWQAAPEVSLYASYTENFGNSASGLRTFDGRFLPAENARQGEVGVKAELLDRRLTASAALFNIDKFNVLVEDLAHGGDPFYTTIGGVRSRGVELDVAGQLAPGWSAIATYAYTDARYLEGDPAQIGKRFTGVPFHSATLWTTYAVQSGALQGLKGGGGLVARSSQLYDADRSIPGYVVANLMASYAWQMGKTTVTAQLNLDNLLDATYYASLDNIPGRPFSLAGVLRVER
ncbi:MAG: TonB-dependent receptor [Anaeromyxobacter sp.]|nr:TonB-dependent receptor [Anaeromyxobacter sp.]MBL0274867.1 TonB-dependent receptor [Anaeromyxobacter sp.]